MIPDRRDVPQKLFATGLYNLKSEDGQGAFTDAVVATLHGLDENWQHLRKNASQTHVHRHGEDSALYLLPNDQAQAVDFIGGAGGPNPQPGWNPDSAPIYKHADAHDPFDHGIGGGSAPTPQPPTYPSYEALGGDEGGKKITRQLEADYRRAGKPGLDGDCGAWQQRVSYDFLTGICATVEEAITKHRKEWCDALGIPL